MAVYNATPHHTTPHHTHNFFSVSDNFFIIDSENLSDAKTKLYGFSVQESGIYDRHNFTPEAAEGLDGNGVYVYVEKSDRQIVIRQDFAGCYGLYVYKSGGRFVVSNSFLCLMEYMSSRAKLTLNRDYANHYLIMGLSSMAYSETFIDEITVLPRDVIVRIDIPSAKLSTERINYGENTVRLNSAEGMKILDRWLSKWAGIFRNIYDKTETIETDLSGGLDSRMSFVLLMNAGIDLSKVFVHSVKAKGYTFEEDYTVASMIAERFGFTLNNSDNRKGGELNYSGDDIINIVSYMRMFNHNQLDVCRSKAENKRYHVTGFWGETLRKYFSIEDNSFMRGNKSGAYVFSGRVNKELANSMERIITHLLDEISHKTNTPISDDFSPHIHREVGGVAGRFHFGTAALMRFTGNQYPLCPLVDADLSRLKLNDESCTDQNLLMAVIFTRYCPELLTIRFTGNETINPATLDFARKINAQYPRPEFHAVSREFSIVPNDSEVSALLAGNNSPLEADFPVKYFKKLYESQSVRKLFATCFDEEIYVYAEEYFRKNVHQRIAKCFTVVATAEVIKRIIISRGTQSCGITDDFREFEASDFESVSDKKTDKIIRRTFLIRNIRKKIVSFPFRAVRKIIRIIRRK